MEQTELLQNVSFGAVAYENPFFGKLERNNDVTTPWKSASVRQCSMPVSFRLCWRYLVALAYLKK